MYLIRKPDKLSTTKTLLNRTMSLGLGITALQLYVELIKIFHLLRVSISKENGNFYSSSLHQNAQSPQDHLTSIPCPDQRSDHEPCSEHGQTQIFSQDLKRYLIIGAFVYAQIFVALVDTYLFSVILTATRRESMSNATLGAYLQMTMLLYNIAEILLVAYNGVFDASSMILAGRATARAISVEVIFLFLKDLQEKKDNDIILYNKILIV